MSSERPLDRREASQYLLERHGIKRAAGTLAKLASIGGGPLYRLAGRQAIYELPHLDEYAAHITSAPAVSSSEHAARCEWRVDQAKIHEERKRRREHRLATRTHPAI